eukprot:615591-Rhodomonas_salina.4
MPVQRPGRSGTELAYAGGQAVPGLAVQAAARRGLSLFLSPLILPPPSFVCPVPRIHRSAASISGCALPFPAALLPLVKLIESGTAHYVSAPPFPRTMLPGPYAYAACSTEAVRCIKPNGERRAKQMEPGTHYAPRLCLCATGMRCAAYALCSYAVLTYGVQPSARTGTGVCYAARAIGLPLCYQPQARHSLSALSLSLSLLPPPLLPAPPPYTHTSPRPKPPL